VWVFTLMARPGRFDVVTNIRSVRQSQRDDSAIKTLNPSPEFPWALLLGARCFPEGEGFDLFFFQFECRDARESRLFDDVDATDWARSNVNAV
jgi:hypothetical protein